MEAGASTVNHADRELDDLECSGHADPQQIVEVDEADRASAFDHHQRW